MIPNQWYVILESKEVKPGKVLGVTRFGEKLVQGDGPVIEYRRRRAALIDAASRRKIETITSNQEMMPV